MRIRSKMRHLGCPTVRRLIDRSKHVADGMLLSRKTELWQGSKRCRQTPTSASGAALFRSVPELQAAIDGSLDPIEPAWSFP
jgi:hypothetical protein